MRALVYSIMFGSPSPPSAALYCLDLRTLVLETLSKDPRRRPSVNTILAKTVIRDKISTFLNPEMMHVRTSF